MEEVGTTLICGPSEVTDTFVFEGALHWAREGRRVVYVTPVPLESLPPRYHESVGFRGEHLGILQLIKFMYLPDYRSLADILVDLDTFVAPPSVLFIDKLENYTPNSGDAGPGSAELLIAKTCAVAMDTMKACSRTLKRKVHLCATLPAEALGKVHSIYFDNIWRCSIDETNPSDPEPEGKTIIFKKVTCAIDEQAFKFKSLRDGTIVLQEIFKEVYKYA
ncbi:uncharacterized protein LOC105684989 isoform X2 [Athalia rosae]|uniref:uncharacterized protein LOC105684989 isoform X2 n=1 Tax=Athalia rosae TaxID=37344 RepID=UPI002033B8C4|nr:uncharacterized protein LOC105684989 isoform X2 [Athalia rosae]